MDKRLVHEAGITVTQLGYGKYLLLHEAPVYLDGAAIEESVGL